MRPGDLLVVSCSAYSHVGIATESGTVVHSSKQLGYAAEETLEVFAAGKPVHMVAYRGPLPRWAVVARARAQIGRPWRLLDNCEHVASRSQGLPATSGQFAAAVVVLGLLAAAN